MDCSDSICGYSYNRSIRAGTLTWTAVRDQVKRLLDARVERPTNIVIFRWIIIIPKHVSSQTDATGNTGAGSHLWNVLDVIGYIARIYIGDDHRSYF